MKYRSCISQGRYNYILLNHKSLAQKVTFPATHSCLHGENAKLKQYFLTELYAYMLYYPMYMNGFYFPQIMKGRLNPSNLHDTGENQPPAHHQSQFTWTK